MPGQEREQTRQIPVIGLDGARAQSPFALKMAQKSAQGRVGAKGGIV